VLKFRRAKWAGPVDGIRRVEDVGCTGVHEESWWLTPFGITGRKLGCQ
jgi:hypothetical protein